MSISKYHTKLIADIHRKVNYLFMSGFDENTVLVKLQTVEPEAKSIVQQTDTKQLELYTNAYTGFHCYLNLIHRQN
ncbi:MAG: hypothetical protein H0U75_11750 [Legionella sp.]|nr:hypothetical protein [Legionella sp.]